MGDIISKKKKLVEPFHANGGFFGSLRDGQGMIKQFMAYKLDKEEFGWAIDFKAFRQLYRGRGLPMNTLRIAWRVWDSENKGKLDALQIFAATILCSTGTFNEKISALFNLFDMDANGHVTEPEMTILMKCVLNGFCTLTGKQPVDTQRLATITHVAFVSVDQQETRDFKIEVGELLTWASSNAEPVYLLCRYNTTDGAQIKDRLKRKNSHSTHHQHRTHGHKVRDGKDGHAHAHERQRESASAVPAGTPRAHMNQKRTSNSTRNKRSSPKSARGSNLHAGKRGQGGKGGKAGKTNRRGTVVIDYSEMNRRKMERKQQRSRQQNVATYVNAVYDEKEVRRFKDLFDEADRNGDGRVDCTHLKEVIRKAADKDIDWAKIAKYHMSNNVNKNGQGSNVKDEKEGSGGHNVHNHPTGKETTSSSSHDGESGNSRGKNKETSNTSKSDDSSDRVHRTSDGHGKVGVQRGLQITFREFLVGLYPRALKEELDLMDGWFQYKKLPTNIITRIKHLFDEMDEIYDGKVLTDEIIGVLSRSRRLKEVITVEPVGAEDPKFLTLFELCDRLFQKEYARALVDLKKWLRPSKALAREQVKDLSLLFEMYDKDASGYIDFKELRSIMLDHATGINLTADDIKALFKRFDADDDKRVSRKEFFLFYRNVWDGEVNFELNLFSTSIGSRR